MPQNAPRFELRSPKWAAACTSACGRGVGLAVCPSLSLVVTSNFDDNTLGLFHLPHPATSTQFHGLGTVGGPGTGPLQFSFTQAAGLSGFMCFAPAAVSGGCSTPSATAGGAAGVCASAVGMYTLLVTEAGNDRVQELAVVRGGLAAVMDVTTQVEVTHVGWLYPPGAVLGPRGVAASQDLIAVSAFATGGEGLHAIHLFHSASRAPVRVVGDGCGDGGGQLKSPHGVRLSTNGRTVVVADMANGRVAEFDVHTGAWIGDVTRSVRGMTDVEECAGGWLVVCSSSNLVAQVLEVVGPASMPSSSKWAIVSTFGRRSLQLPCSMALVPCVGMLVRQAGVDGALELFCSQEDVNMAGMSRPRVAWMVAVARGIMLGRGASCRPAAP